MGADRKVRPLIYGRSKIFKNNHLSSKIIYVIATGAKKIDKLPELITLLDHYQADVYLLTSKVAYRMMQSTRLIEELENLNLTIVTDYGHPFELPREDLIVIAPCTFNSLQKLSTGISDNYILTIAANAIARKTPVVIAPAFNELWHHPRTAVAIQTLTEWGIRVVWPKITKDKATMMDITKISDTVHAELSKIKFSSKQLFNSKLQQLRNSRVNKHLDSFIEAGLRQYERKLNNTTHGCYSIRLENNWMLISSSGAKLHDLSADDLTLVEISNSDIISWVGTKPPSSETPLHIQCYITVPHFSAVVHSHSPAITYSSEKQHLATPKYIEYGVFDGAEEVCRQCDEQSGFVILKYHGELAAATTLKGALKKIAAHEK